MSTAITIVNETAPDAWWRLILDEMDYGIVVMSNTGVLHVNRAARHQLSKGASLQLLGRQLVALDPQDNAELRRALDAALTQRRRRLLTLATRTRALPLAVVPLAVGLAGPALALVVIGRRGLCSQLAMQWFCMMHGLSPAESSVLTDLLEGHEPRVIAARNGVALSTVRTQIASITDKTALHGIRELLMAAATLPPLVSAQVEVS